MMCRRNALALALAAWALLSTSCTDAKVRHLTARPVREYPHDPAAYTQGLFFHDGTLYESTGEYGRSSMRTVDLATGEVLTRLDFARKYFAEGSVILGGELFILTWTNRVAFRYDATTLTYTSTHRYPREGWGLTTDGRQLIASDGSSTLYFMDTDFVVKRRLGVTLDGRPVRLLNELEWIGGKVWANVYTTDTVVIIDPASGRVEATVDCAGLLPEALRDDTTDVLNGIACDAEGRIYLTGKNWPRLYEIELVEK